MRKHFLTLLLLTVTFCAQAQSSRGIRIGYIDMEYILENVPDYNEANIQLDSKAQKWKQDIESKKNEISKLKESLKTEEVLLTKELVQEREEEIAFKEKELEEFQQKKFGPSGEFITQKAVLTKPVQDQVFTIVQDLAETRKYDFIFDKSSDMTILFAAKRYDLSDYVVRSLTRAAKRNQMSKKQLKEEEAKEYKENLEDLNPEMAEKQKMLDDKKAAREKLLEERKATIEAKRQEAEARRKQMQEERTKKATEPKTTAPNPSNQSENSKKAPETNIQEQPTAPKTEPKKSENVNPQAGKNQSVAQPVTAKPAQSEKEDAAAAQQKAIEEKRKAIEERKAKVLAEREAARKAKEEKAKQQQEEQQKK